MTTLYRCVHAWGNNCPRWNSRHRCRLITTAQGYHNQPCQCRCGATTSQPAK